MATATTIIKCDLGLVRSRSAALLGAALVAHLVGCASSTVSMRNKPPDDIPRPPVVLVYDFAVHAEDVVVDQLGPSMNRVASESERIKTGRLVAHSLSQQLIVDFVEEGIPAQHADFDTRPPLNALIIKGTFVEVNEGDMAKRVTIGFGAGAESLEVYVQIYQQTDLGLRQINEAIAQTHGDKMPGMAVPVAGGAIAGTAATSAAISGGMNLVSETKAGLNSAVGRLSKKLVERAVGYWELRGWR